MNRKAVKISIVIITLIVSALIVIFSMKKNKNIYISNINETGNIKLSMIKVEDETLTIIKEVPESGNWIMTYNCENDMTKLYWDNDNRKILIKNLSNTECTVRFEKSKNTINIISMYVGEEYVESLDEERYYKLVSYECANEENINWDSVTREVKISPLNQNTYCNLYFEEGIEEFSANGVNKPVLAQGMTPVKWTGTPGNYTEVQTTENDPEWYDYNNKKWANAISTDGSYWVWIPRYAYKIKSGYNTNEAGEIDIKFLIGTTNQTIDETIIETEGYNADTKNTSMHYFVHPVFQNNPTNGGWNSEILGFWVAKYEASGTVGDISIKPNITSLRSLTIGNMYDAVYSMRNITKYGWNGTNIDTHMMKNTEWGAVAYLAQSKYGANQELYKNNSNTFTTGCAGNEMISSSFSGCQNAYNTELGVNASTTYNITGIYDMNGGAWEYVASYAGSATTYGSSIINANLKYKNIYTSYEYSSSKNRYGDAMWEISTSGTGNTSWNGDYSDFLASSDPWSRRGGDYSDPSSGGIFAFRYCTGVGDIYRSFRVSLIP